jgi:hypothetical protein
MKRKGFIKRITAIVVMTVLFISIIFFSGAAYVLGTSDIYTVIMEASGENISYIPQWFSKFYMLNFRGGREDLDFMKNARGLNLVINGLQETRFQYASFFLSKGYEINTVPRNGLALLHAAVINNDTEAVKFLLRNGADPNVRVGINHKTEYEGKPLEMKISGMNAIELARHMSEMDKTQKDRSTILELLTKK